MQYNFDEIIDRTGTHAIKSEAGELLKQFGMTQRFDADTIPLFVADMDFPCPQPVLEALHARVDRAIFGYSLHLTTPDYTEAIQGWFKRRHDWEIEAESIVYCPGTVTALHISIRAFTKAGEGVIIQPPVYQHFMSAVEDEGRVVVNNPLVENDGYYTIDFEDLERKASNPDNTLFLLCSPHNPTGRVWTAEELTRMAEICVAHDVILIADEIHGDLIRAGQVHLPIHTLVDDPRIISCTAINKTFNTAGLHCSNIILPDEALRTKFSETLGFKTPSPFAIAALIAAYNQGEDWLQQVNTYIDDNLTFMDEFFKTRMPAVKYQIPEGTYIAWADFSGYGLTPDEVQERITMQANVVLQRGEVFGPEGVGYQRICVPSPRSSLEEALERIAAVF